VNAPLLDVHGVSKRYDPPPVALRPFIRMAATGSVEALRDVSLEVSPGEIVGLLGPNGAGKTTLIKIIAGLLDATQGLVIVDGFNAAADAWEVRRRLGLVLPDERGLYWRLSGRRNLEFFGMLHGLGRKEARARADELLEVMGLADRDKLVFGYSSGMRARLSIARALTVDPPLLVLDEPTRSLDPLASEDVMDLLRSQADAGRAILMSSHRLDEVAAVCDRVVALAQGNVVYDDRVPTAGDRIVSLKALLTRSVAG
jgi:ABC-type multidrug transport system ATPase subunit